MSLSELEQWCNEGIPIGVNFTTSREEANNFAKQYSQPPYIVFSMPYDDLIFGLAFSLGKNIRNSGDWYRTIESILLTQIDYEIEHI